MSISKQREYRTIDYAHEVAVIFEHAADWPKMFEHGALAQTEHVFLQVGAPLNQSSNQAANLENYKCKNMSPSLKSIIS